MEGCILLVRPLVCDLVRAEPGSPFVGYTMVRADRCSPLVGHTLGLICTWAPDLLTSWAPGLLASWSPVLLGSWAPGLLGFCAPGHLAPGTWHLAPGTWHLAPGTWHLAPRLLPRHLASSFSGSGATGAGDVVGSLFLGLRRSWVLQLPTGNLLGLL